MELDIFEKRIKILNNREGDILRKKYIEKFINRTKPSYFELIERMEKFEDGYCYRGYLWDYMREPIIVDRKFIQSLSENINRVYVFWDIHSRERIFIKDYWKFGKDSVLELSYKDLMQSEEFLPEDIYIFDCSFDWTIVLTHEDIDGQRYCLKCGDI